MRQENNGLIYRPPNAFILVWMKGLATDSRFTVTQWAHKRTPSQMLIKFCENRLVIGFEGV